MPTRAVIYARVSSDLQRDNYSLSTQVEQCRIYAAQRGYCVIAVCQDVHTGTAMERPVLAQILDLAADRQLDVVIVHELDRFTRIPEHLAILEMEFEAAGVTIEYVLGESADSDEARLSKQLKSFIAHYELVQRVDRSRRGKSERARSGAILATGKRAPYGYRYGAERRSYVIDEGEAAVVRSLYAWRLAGASAYQLADRLTQMGVVRPDGRAASWLPSTVLRILRSPTYAGRWRFGRLHPQRRSALRHQRQAPEPVDVPVPAIVDEATWQAVQTLLNQAQQRSPRRFYLLSGLVFCRCGRRWVGSARDDNRVYYRCVTIQERFLRKACTMPGGIRTAYLDPVVWDEAVRLLLQPELLQAEYERQAAAVRTSSASRTARLTAATADLTQVELRLADLLDQLLEERITPIQFASARSTLLAEQERLLAHIARLRSELAERLPARPDVNWEEMHQIVAAGVTHLDAAAKRQVLQLLQTRVVILRQTLARVEFFGGLIVRPVPVHHDWKRVRVRKLRRPRRPRTIWSNDL